ncbi:MAG: two-component system LytT family sensor kinase, partial [Enterobacterales bacterium]
SSSFRYLIRNKNALFWTIQIIGWGGLFILSSLTLTLFYNDPELPYIAHNLVRSLLGIVLTIPMRYIYSRIWGKPLIQRFAIVILVALVISIIWTLIIIETFQIMTKEQILLFDYGGWFYSSIFIFMSWAASYHGFKYYILLQKEHKNLLKSQAEQQQTLLKQSEAENQTKLAKLKFLSYQLNPHFIFNTLNSVYSMIESKNDEGAKKMLILLSQFLRSALLQQQDNIIVPLKHELSILQKYLEIEKIRFGSRLNIEIDCSEESQKVGIPIYLLQPLVENSIKYAVSKTPEGGTIRVSSKFEDNKLRLLIEDTGYKTLANVDSINDGTGLGLTNTQKRLSVMYPDEYDFVISESELGGTKVLIRIPLDVGLNFNPSGC